ncbi:MAG TPA: hypothetical protein VK211_19315 [Kamptonema sp.]|nr:hypothetical protein [Kamptonema sp.]
MDAFCCIITQAEAEYLQKIPPFYSTESVWEVGKADLGISGFELERSRLSVGSA